MGALIVLLVAWAALPAQAQSFTLEQILSAPFPSDLVAASSGGKFAWVQDDRGARNLWVAESPAYQGRQVTRYAEDDGQELANVQFTPDGQSLVYVRGGPPNRAGEVPNPTSDPDGAEQAIWIVSLANGTPRQLAQGTAPTVSPKGDVLAFLRRGEVWTVSLADSAAKPAQLFRARGNQGSLEWSPDGMMLAFVSGRGDHSFIGLYDIGRKEVRYLEPSVDRDGQPTWSPDGQRIAYVRLPGFKRALPFIERREGEPWSIRVAEVATGSGREVWRAERGTGSVFHGIVAERQLFWSAGDRIVFRGRRTAGSICTRCRWPGVPRRC